MYLQKVITGSGAGLIGIRGADPDPYQNFTDPNTAKYVKLLIMSDLD